MLTAETLPLDDVIRSQLEAVAGEVSSDESREFQRLLPGVSAKARAAGGHWDFGAPARVIDELIGNPFAFHDCVNPEVKARLRRVAVARLALRFFEVEDHLTDAILALYPDFFSQLARFLLGRARYNYEEYCYVKDVRYALGLTVPCGAHQLDLRARVGAKLILRDVVATRSAQSALAYAAALGWGRWYSNHLDLRAMKEFSPRGWTASFVRMAEMLALNSRVRGIAGVSWFYDPCVAVISPHLAYIQTPTNHGAFLAKMGSDAHHIANATIRSSVRQKLYKEGKYFPTCYLLAWPRNALIEWAKRLKSDPSLSFSNAAPSSGDIQGGFVPVAPASAHRAVEHPASPAAEKHPDGATASPVHERV
jgi:hypothetical protein